MSSSISRTDRSITADWTRAATYVLPCILFLEAVPMDTEQREIRCRLLTLVHFDGVDPSYLGHGVHVGSPTRSPPSGISTSLTGLNLCGAEGTGHYC
jgi:hypothetical protein